MATRALSGFCILFLLLSASHVLPSTEAARILDENKAAGAGIHREDASITYPIIGTQPRPQPGPQRGNPYRGRCARLYGGCHPPPPPPT